MLNLIFNNGNAIWNKTFIHILKYMKIINILCWHQYREIGVAVGL